MSSGNCPRLLFVIITLGILASAPRYACAQSTVPRGDYLIGVYYFSGWWREEPNKFVIGGRNWRDDYPEREPLCGWYDDTQEAMDEQILQAAEYGVDFFNILWYPVDQNHLNNGVKLFLTSRNKVRMKFCITYVNHPPFGLITDGEWDKATDEWVTYFKDPQYLKIDGKPVFIIHTVFEFEKQLPPSKQHAPLESVRQRLDLLRQKAIGAGFPGVLIGGGGVMAQVSNVSDRILQEGYDFLTDYAIIEGDRYRTEVRLYKDLIYLHQTGWTGFEKLSPIPYVPCITSGWDPRPWYGPAAMYYTDRTPENFRLFLERARTLIDRSPRLRIPTNSGEGQKVLLIYSWNEFGEGGHILPTKGDGYAFLNVIKDFKLARGTVPQDLPGEWSKASEVSISLGRKCESYGLKLVEWPDGITEPVEIGGIEARKPVRTQYGSMYFYFEVNDEFLSYSNTEVLVTVTYYDNRGASFRLEYDSADSSLPMDGAYKTTGFVSGRGSDTWREYTFALKGVRFANRQNAGADFRILAMTDKVYISRVAVRLPDNEEIQIQ